MKQLDPKAVWFFFFSFVFRAFPMLIFFCIIFAQIFLFNYFGPKVSNNGGEFMFALISFWWVLIPAFLILCFAWAKLTYRFYKYELLDTGFRKESGVIYKKYVTIPYDRIQNVDINRGILSRILGLSDLNIQTAGSSVVMSRYGAMGVGAEGRLPAVSMVVGEQLRDELIERARKSKNQGL